MQKNIPFTLELIKLYNATVCSFDPCSQKSILKINTAIDNINETINKMNKVKKANITSDDIHEIAITIVAYVLLFGIIAIALMLLSRCIISYCNIPDDHALAKFETVFIGIGTFVVASVRFIKKLGVSHDNISLSNINTATNPDFFSHYRSMHDPSKKEGRFIFGAGIKHY